MTHRAPTAPMRSRPAAETAADVTRGWYVYGVTRRGSLTSVLALVHNDGDLDLRAGDAPHDVAPLQLLELSDLVAVVRPVSLNDFTTAALEERLASPSRLEAMVRSHNDVIEAIHAQQAILPAKFGMVHAHADDVLSALRSSHDGLLEQLNQLEGCDEWAVHLSADCAIVRQRIADEHPAIRQLREQRAGARPGRAYFLEQQIRDELQLAVEVELSELAQSTFERLSIHAVDGQVTPLAPAADFAGDLEILRASFLVRREFAEGFEAAVRSSDTCEGLRAEYSGPWPPYSFAAAYDEVAQ